MGLVLRQDDFFHIVYLGISLLIETGPYNTFHVSTLFKLAIALLNRPFSTHVISKFQSHTIKFQIL